jgi:hypothetical protein
MVEVVLANRVSYVVAQLRKSSRYSKRGINKMMTEQSGFRLYEKGKIMGPRSIGCCAHSPERKRYLVAF